MEARAAATVMLVRDAAGGRMEVLLLRRHPASTFAPGASVFPGGAVDAQDGDEALGRRSAGRDDPACCALLGLGSGGLAHWVAAIRECFEEAGVLLARRPAEDGVLSLLRPDVAERFAGHRAALRAGRPFREVLEDEDLVLDAGGLHYVSHWVTPEGAPRRYDTRFFVAAAPPEQVPAPDDAEVVASTWIDPAEALARHRRGELALVLPTIRNLELLSGFDRVDDVLDAARRPGQVPTIRPRLVSGPGGVRILVPGDPGYDDVAAAP